MNSGTVHLVATDPPFNKNKDFHATPDSLASGAKFKDRWKWDEDVHEEWIDQIQDDWPGTWAVIEASRSAYGADMAAFLCWLGVRLMEMRRVLREDGSIYLHIDHTAHAYVKALMDSIFGSRNFQNEIVWSYGLGGSSPKRWSRKHDTILFYTKTEAYNFTKPTQPATSLKMKGQNKGMTDVWDIPTINNMAKERMGYPTQKPLDLYQRIVKASSSEGDIVLDPFCGCATTHIAAEKLGRLRVGMDIWDGAHEIVLQRLVDEGLAVPGDHHASDRLITFGNVHYETEPPVRTDDDEVAAPKFQLRIQRAAQPWQQLANKTIRNILAYAQEAPDGKVWCAGCGRSLEIEFMHLDHILPKSDRGDNFITNRILLCGPCNSTKGNKFTMKGLHSENKRKKWMVNETRANDALNATRDLTDRIRDDWGAGDITMLVVKADG